MLNRDGILAGSGNLAAQIGQVVASALAVLDGAGAEPQHMLRSAIYVAHVYGRGHTLLGVVQLGYPG